MQYVDRIKTAMQGQVQQEKNLLGQMDDAVTMSWKTRLIAFGSCVAFGFLLAIVSIPMLWVGNIISFAVLYSLGTLTSIASTVFLMGPVKQIQRMFEQHRIIATVVMLISVVLTLVFAFKLENPGVCLVMIFVQFVALCWYCLTWIPGGTTAVKAMITGST